MRICAWCRVGIEPTLRSDARTCSKRCRQALHRFGRYASRRAYATQRLRFGYGDPPYPGLAKRYYKSHPDYAGEVDHRELLSRLQHYDGWALSTSSRALPVVLDVARQLGLAPQVGAWFRGARKIPSHRPVQAWEPVVYAGGRQDMDLGPREDAIICRARPRLTDPARVIGAKPAAFCYWLFDLLGARPGDTFDDLFPGSGGVSRAWELYVSRAAAGDVSRLEDGHA